MLGSLLDQIKGAIGQHANEPNNNYDSNGLMGTIEGLFGQHAANTGQDMGGGQNMGGGQILGSSQDPYGDPADQRSSQNTSGQILGSSQDPYGDPADQR